MKKIVFLILILFSCKNNNVDINVFEDNTQDYTFITLNDTINVPFVEYQKLKEIFQTADSLVVVSNTVYNCYIEYIGRINYYDFTYHHLYTRNSKLNLIFDYIIINDTINHKEVHISKFDNFVDNLL